MNSVNQIMLPAPEAFMKIVLIVSVISVLIVSAILFWHWVTFARQSVGLWLGMLIYSAGVICMVAIMSVIAL